MTDSRKTRKDLFKVSNFDSEELTMERYLLTSLIYNLQNGHKYVTKNML